MTEHWSRLADDWIGHADLPLLLHWHDEDWFYFGGAHTHDAGPTFVCVDEAPSTWILASVLLGVRPTLDELYDALKSGEFPVARDLRARRPPHFPSFRGELAFPREGVTPRAQDLERAGWRVACIRSPRVPDLESLDAASAEDVEEWHRRVADPANLILVPASQAGLATTPSFLAPFLE